MRTLCGTLTQPKNKSCQNIIQKQAMKKLFLIVIAMITTISARLINWTHRSTRLCTMARYKLIDWLIDWFIGHLGKSGRIDLCKSFIGSVLNESICLHYLLPSTVFSGLGFVSLNPVHCAYIYLCLSVCMLCVFVSYCIVVVLLWTWWSGPNVIEVSSLGPIFLQCFNTVGWVIWPVKPIPDMTYNVFGGMLNLAQSMRSHHPCGRFLHITASVKISKTTRFSSSFTA